LARDVRPSVSDLDVGQISGHRDLHFIAMPSLWNRRSAADNTRVNAIDSSIERK